MLFSQIKTWFIFNNFVIWWLAKQHFKSQNVSKNVFSVCYVVFFVCFFLSKNVSLHFELIVDVETYMHLLIEMTDRMLLHINHTEETDYSIHDYILDWFLSHATCFLSSLSHSNNSVSIETVLNLKQMYFFYLFLSSKANKNSLIGNK